MYISSFPPGVGCALDSSSTAVLRPRSALTVGDTSCCRLRITNTTPIPTHVSWEPALGSYFEKFDVSFYKTTVECTLWNEINLILGQAE